MNIELANLPSLATSVGAIEGASSVSPVMTEAGLVAEDFSHALVVQLELLNAIKTEDSIPLQMPIQVTLSENVSAPPAGLLADKADGQDFADLLGNNLPLPYKVKNDGEHEAVLAAVTDTLKYMATGAVTAGEKAEQNMQEVIAWGALNQPSAEQAVASAAPVLKPAEQPVAGAASVLRPAEQPVAGAASVLRPAEQPVAGAASVLKPAEQPVAGAAPVLRPAEQPVAGAAPVLKPAEQPVAGAAPVLKLAEQPVAGVASVLRSEEQPVAGAASVLKPAEQPVAGAASMVKPAEQPVAGAASMVKPAEQPVAGVAPVLKPAEQPVAGAAPVLKPAEQAAVEIDTQAKQNRINLAGQGAADAVEQDVKSGVVMNAPVQMGVLRASDKTDKKQNKDEVPVVDVEDALDTENRGAANILPVAMSADQGMPVNNLADNDTVKGGMPSFTKPLGSEDKPNMPAKAPDSALQGEPVLGQSVQDKQGTDLKYVATPGQTEKAVGEKGQPLALEGEKSLPRVGGADVAQFRPIDNKADVPAITKPLSHPEWNKDLGERIVWMSNRAIPAAEIRLNPQHLGPVSVRVNVADDQATIMFTAQNAATREALEASIPKLREMMNAQQLNLVDVTVAHGSASDQGRSQAQYFAQTADRQGRGAVDGGVVVDEVGQDIEGEQAVVSNGLLSLYA
ncbi:MAG: flagellar hook-length control protein FliK [Methylococcales bacterium]|nr:flagellar hook-length control protein FliK [Methylococcales bacterium]